MPRYSRSENWKPDEEDVERSTRPPGEDVMLRALSVVPFVLVAAFGVIALVGWVIVVVFGFSAPGNADAQPIWRWAQGRSAGEVIGQLAIAVGIGLIPLAVTLIGSWCIVHGFRERPHPLFWPSAQLFWGIVAIGWVVLDHTRHAFLVSLGVGTLDWWFVFLMIAAAIVLAAMRTRRLRGSRG